MFKILQYYIFLAIIFMGTSRALAQKNERIRYKADKLEYGKKNGESYRKLTDNVIFTQKETTVYCDSSFFYNKMNVMEAFGHVKIVDDSTTITSNKLVYEGDNRMAKLRENVVYVRGERRLYTDFLNYDLEAEIANYFDNGKLVDTTNTLTSEIGYFFAKDNYAQFYNDVVLIAPDFTLKTDTLRYNTITKVAYTYGTTEIVSEDGTVLHALGGEFRTITDQSEFTEGHVETDDYTLEGDQLYFDDVRKYYKAIGHVKLTAKEKDVIIIGEEGYYDKESEISKIFGNPIMKRILEADTFYLAADTLVAIESAYDSAKRILAYHDIRIYKEGLQGIADSMAYFRADSLIYFYRDPVMWNERNQIVADTISLEIGDNQIEKMNLMTNSFLISEDTIQNYNQIKGRQMVAYFEENQIDHIDVDGNGEILYFALEEGDSSLMGMNKIFCAHMKITFRNQQLSNFRVYNNPEAQFIPPHELTDEIQRLASFAWREDERPLLFEVAPYLDPNYDPNAVVIEPLPSVSEADTIDSNRSKTDSALKNSTPRPANSVKNSTQNRSGADRQKSMQPSTRPPGQSPTAPTRSRTSDTKKKEILKKKDIRLKDDRK